MSTGRTDPLSETLFRSTVAPVDLSSAAPVRAGGLHARAGNAMNRTRTALLDGARRAVEQSGTKVTMSQIAAASGVAKATLYNHFRTREAVLDALAEAEIAGLIELARAADDLTGALIAVGEALSGNWMLRSLGELDPSTLVTLGRIDLSAPGWRAARDAVREQLDHAGLGGSLTVLRWLSSFFLTPGDSTSIAGDVAVLVAGLPALRVADAARTA
jgi:AcrR family transcriptional regulator